MEIATAGLLAGLASAGAQVANNAWNIGSTNKINARQEALMRESWAREDNAVQRRVADLKAAGLSPTLAAGSAAASSGPIKLNTPRSELDGVIGRSLEASSAVQALKTQSLQNANLKKQGELLDLQARYMGLPDWYVAGERIFGAQQFGDALKKVGPKLYEWINGLFTSPGSSAPDSVDVSKAVETNGASAGLSSDQMNSAVEQGLKNAGIDTRPDTSKSTNSIFNPSNYGKDVNDAAQNFVSQMIKDNKLDFETLGRLAKSMSTIYNISEGELQRLFAYYISKSGASISK